MACPECGEKMTGSYDGGEANDYRLCVPACNYCGYVDWDAAEDDEQEEEDARTSANMFVWTTPYRFGAR